MIIAIVIFIIINLLFLMGCCKLQEQKTEMQLQQLMCDHCIFRPKVKTLDMTISYCPYRESEKQCTKSSIIGIYRERKKRTWR